MLPAQDAPPIPRPDVAQMAAGAVAEVLADGNVRLTISAGQRDVALAGVAWPANEPARQACHQFLERLLAGETVLVQDEPIQQDGAQARDGAQATTHAWLFRVPDGLFVNLEPVRQGYAGVEPGTAGQHAELLSYYEQRARLARKGIWASPTGSERAAQAGAPAAASAPSAPDLARIVVYVTKSGTKYHRKDCPHLRRSARALSLKEALERGYEPCAQCKPPTRDKPE